MSTARQALLHAPLDRFATLEGYLAAGLRMAR